MVKTKTSSKAVMKEDHTSPTIATTIAVNSTPMTLSGPQTTIEVNTMNALSLPFEDIAKPHRLSYLAEEQALDRADIPPEITGYASEDSERMRASVVENLGDETVSLVADDHCEATLLSLFGDGDWIRAVDKLEELESYSDSSVVRGALTETNELGETPIHVAAWKAPTLILMLVLDIIPQNRKKAHLLRLDNHGNTILHLAMANLGEDLDFTAIKEILVMAPEALELPNNFGDTPLHLLVASRGFHRRGRSGQAALDFTVEASAEEAICSVLAMVGHLATSTNHAGLNLLHVAIGNGAHERVLVQLLALSPELARITDARGMLPLHYVAAYGGTPWTFVRQLIASYPESLVCQSDDGDTAMHLLVANATQHLNKDQFFDRNTTKLAELLSGSAGGLDEEDAPLTIQNKGLLTPLHLCAVFEIPPQLTRILMEKGRSSGPASAITDGSGSTALHMACASDHIAEMGWSSVVEALVTPEACSVVDRDGNTPLMLAVRNRRSSSTIIKTLTKANLEAVAVPSLDGLVPLHAAVQSSRAKQTVVRILLKAYPDSIMILTPDGSTVLHEALRYGAPSGVVELIRSKHPAAVDQLNDRGEKPSDLTTARTRTSVKKVYCAPYGDDKNIADVPSLSSTDNSGES